MAVMTLNLSLVPPTRMFSLKISYTFFLPLGSQNFTSWLTYCVTMLDKCLKHILSDLFHLSWKVQVYCPFQISSFSIQFLFSAHIVNSDSASFRNPSTNLQAMWGFAILSTTAFYSVSEHLCICHYIFIL